MKPQEALNLLEQATGLLQLNRQDHDNIRLALSVLREKHDIETSETRKPK